MKASFYLALSGHYRQAIIIQRCVFENFLYGMYFFAEHNKFSEGDEDKNEVNSKFRSWLSGGFRKSDAYLREIIRKAGFISKQENDEWANLFNELSQFVHTILQTPTGRAIKYANFEIKSCYSLVIFDRNSLMEWSNYYQKVFFIILYQLIRLFPVVKTTEAGKLALRILRNDFRDIRKKHENPYLERISRMRIRKTA